MAVISGAMMRPPTGLQPDDFDNSYENLTTREATKERDIRITNENNFFLLPNLAISIING